MRLKLSNPLKKAKPENPEPSAPGAKPAAAEEEYSFSDKLNATSYYMFKEPAREISRQFKLDRSIAASGMYVPPEVYVSKVFLLALLTTPIIMISTAVMMSTQTLPVILLLVVISAIFTPLMIFAFSLIYLSFTASGRSKHIDHELPFIAVYLSTMVRGGVSPLVAMERLAKMKWFPAMRKEISRILRDVNLFGLDPLTAIDKNATHHPNRSYRDFMEGYVSTVRTGGDVLHYLESKTENIFENRVSSIKLLAERVAMVTEIFIIISVVLALSFYIFFSISALLPVGSIGSILQFTIFAFVLLPSFSLVTIYLVHTLQPKTMIKMNLPYKVFAISAPIAVGIYYAIAFITNYTISGQLLAQALGLLTASIPAAIAYSRESRGLGGVEDSLASFLRDLTEVRKTGLSPEKCIVLASKRDYGPLNKTVKLIVSQITWGTPLRKVFDEVAKKIRDWFTLVVLNFLVDVIDVGGGGATTMEALARFARYLVDIERDLKQKVKPYMIMPYFGAIMIAASTLLTINLTLSTITISAANPTQRATIDVNQIILLFSSSLLINSWFMGLVAGKIGDTRLAGGFKHAVVLTLLTYVAIAVILSYVLGVA